MNTPQPQRGEPRHHRTGGLDLGPPSEPEPGWRMYLVSEMHDVAATAESFSGVRPGYNSSDSRMERIAKGSGRKKHEVKELLDKYRMMQLLNIKSSADLIRFAIVNGIA